MPVPGPAPEIRRGCLDFVPRLTFAHARAKTATDAPFSLFGNVIGESFVSSTDHQARAHGIADAVGKVWHVRHGSGNGNMLLSVVAGLALLKTNSDHHIAQVRRLIADSGDDEFRATMRYTWAQAVRQRPDLLPALAPLSLCWFGPTAADDGMLPDARAVAVAAVDAGHFELIATARYEVDVLGPILALTRSSAALAARGPVDTPPDNANQITAVTRPGADASHVYEPAVGTGGMFRAAAQAMRANGRDPAAATWTGTDIDPLAIACCAVNAILWDLGPQVALSAADTLTEPDSATTAWKMRAECVTIAQQIRLTNEIQKLMCQRESGTDLRQDPGKSRRS
jgi:hypothetical protein